MNKGNEMKVTVNNTKMVLNQETFVPHKVIDATIELSMEFLVDTKNMDGDMYKECCRKIGEMIINKKEHQ